MHDPKLESQALDYVQGLAVRQPPKDDRFTRAELARHLVGFAEEALRKSTLTVWVVRYGNYYPAEIESLWSSEALAQEHAERINQRTSDHEWTAEEWTVEIRAHAEDGKET